MHCKPVYIKHEFGDTPKPSQHKTIVKPDKRYQCIQENYDGACFLDVFGALRFSLVAAGAGECKKHSKNIEKTSRSAHVGTPATNTAYISIVQSHLFSRCLFWFFCSRRHRLRKVKTTKHQKHRGNKLHRNSTGSAWQTNVYKTRGFSAKAASIGFACPKHCIFNRGSSAIKKSMCLKHEFGDAKKSSQTKRTIKPDKRYRSLRGPLAQRSSQLSSRLLSTLRIASLARGFL